MTKRNMREKFEVKETVRFGRGLFAVRVIKKDERILEFTGPTISFEQALKKPSDKLSCPLQIGPKAYLDIQEPGVMVNHSCLPNAGIRDDKFLVAIEEIQSGEEIFYDYSTTMDEDLWTMTCLCKKSNCRETIRDFKYLSSDVQCKYLDLAIVQSFIGRKFFTLQNKKYNTSEPLSSFQQLCSLQDF